MSFRWPVKDPDETLDYSIDWSRFLGSKTISSVVWSVQTSEIGKTTLASGQTLTTASSNAVTDSIQNVSQSLANTDTVAVINIAGGVLNREYTFTCQITDSTSSVAERTVKLVIREK
tara:strand:+ start:161 stop:511 length:351 start_codon:yes stop_codon:yes gene_type:complete